MFFLLSNNLQMTNTAWMIFCQTLLDFKKLFSQTYWHLCYLRIACKYYFAIWSMYLFVIQQWQRKVFSRACLSEGPVTKNPRTDTLQCLSSSCSARWKGPSVHFCVCNTGRHWETSPWFLAEPASLEVLPFSARSSRPWLSTELILSHKVRWLWIKFQ